MWSRVLVCIMILIHFSDFTFNCTFVFPSRLKIRCCIFAFLPIAKAGYLYQGLIFWFDQLKLNHVTIKLHSFLFKLSVSLDLYQNIHNKVLNQNVSIYDWFYWIYLPDSFVFNNFPIFLSFNTDCIDSWYDIHFLCVSFLRELVWGGFCLYHW